MCARSDEGIRAFGRPCPPEGNSSSVSARRCLKRRAKGERERERASDVRLVKASRREVVRPILFLLVPVIPDPRRHFHTRRSTASHSASVRLRNAYAVTREARPAASFLALYHRALSSRCRLELFLGNGNESRVEGTERDARRFRSTGLERSSARNPATSSRSIESLRSHFPFSKFRISLE